MLARTANPGSLSWGIVGGGMLGMTLALRLRQAGHEVALLEGAPHLGGLASAWRLGDVTWDRHYHVTLLSDTHLRNLLAEIDLDRDVQWVETRTGCYTDGKLHSVSNTIEFLRFPPLRLIDKLRLGLTIFYASKIRDASRLEQIGVSDWLTRWSGRHTFARFWLPLLRAKLGENYRIASAAFIWAVIQRLYAARRTGLKKEMFGYVPGGYARTLAALGDHLVQEGVKVELGVRVASVRASDGGVEVEDSDGSLRSFDRVVVTTAGSIAARLIEGLTQREQELLRGIQYQGIVCASLLTRRPLAGFYVTNITDEAPFTAVIEMSALVDPAEFGDRSLIYLPKYVTPDDPFLEESDERIEELFLSRLEAMYPAFRRDDVEAFRVSRVPYVLAIATLGYSDKLPPTETSVPGVHIANSAHIVNGTLNVNETVELAERSAQELLTSTALDREAGVVHG